MGFTLHDGEEDTPPAMQIEAAFRVKVNEAAEAASVNNGSEEDVTEGKVIVVD